MRVVCIDNFSEPQLEIGKEYEVEYRDMDGEYYLLRDMPFNRDVKYFKREDGMSMDEIRMIKEYHSLNREINRAQSKLEDLQDEKDRLRKRIQEANIYHLIENI